MKRRRKKVALSEPIFAGGHTISHVIVKTPSTDVLLAVHAVDDHVLQHFSFLATMTRLSFLEAVSIPLVDHEAILRAAGEVE